MRKSSTDLPLHLRNGTSLPKRFTDICAQVPTPPKYKIVVFSIDSFGMNYRVVHAYYISLLGKDPLRLQDLMKSRSRTPTYGFEDGRLIEDMIVYKEHLPLNQMAGFSGMIMQLVQDNSSAYTMVRFHNILQYSSDRFNDPIVMSSIDTQ